ncbi:MAG: hypothetical protein ACD_45C00605G0003 [uncultured bacterium]|nr:MAG: hypothetical protein ACD_45C00605G0003 [uncultured bacterium]
MLRFRHVDTRPTASGLFPEIVLVNSFILCNLPVFIKEKIHCIIPLIRVYLLKEQGVWIGYFQGRCDHAGKAGLVQNAWLCCIKNAVMG